jgi:hypothetical protein
MLAAREPDKTPRVFGKENLHVAISTATHAMAGSSSSRPARMPDLPGTDSTAQ